MVLGGQPPGRVGRRQFDQSFSTNKMLKKIKKNLDFPTVGWYDIWVAEIQKRLNKNSKIKWKDDAFGDSLTKAIALVGEADILSRMSRMNIEN